MFNSKVFVAEFIGTFALVFIGAGAAVVGIGGLLGVALAHGLVVTVFAYTYGHISGSHINPAVTFGLALNNTIKWAEAVFYWVAQFAGAIIAAYVLKIIVGSVNLGGIQAGATAGYSYRTCTFCGNGSRDHFDFLFGQHNFAYCGGW